MTGFSYAPSTAQTVRASRYEIVDDTGASKGWFGAVPNGTRLSLNDHDGVERFVVSVIEDGRSELRLSNSADNRVTLSAEPTGVVTMLISTGARQTRILIGAEPSGDAIVQALVPSEIYGIEASAELIAKKQGDTGLQVYNLERRLSSGMRIGERNAAILLQQLGG